MNKRIEELGIEQSIRDIANDLAPDKVNKFHTLIRRMNHFNNLNKLEEVSTSIESFSRVFGRTNLLLTILIISIIGFLIGTFFTYTYLKAPYQSFQYTVNATVNYKPKNIQMITTKKMLNNIKNSSIRNKQEATVGAAIALGQQGLFTYSKKELSSQYYHVVLTSPQLNNKIDFHGFTFLPDRILSIKGIQVDMILDSQLESARHWKQLKNPDLVMSGCGIKKTNDGYYVILPSDMKTVYHLNDHTHN